ncbi:MAG: bifunctional lysylphosphatidylglycerol flippase/synthetase MprF [Sarcina sp.]
MEALTKSRLIYILKIIYIFVFALIFLGVIHYTKNHLGFLGLFRVINNLSFSHFIFILFLGFILFSITPITYLIIKKNENFNLSATNVLYGKFLPARNLYKKYANKNKQDFKFTLILYSINFLSAGIFLFITTKMLSINLNPFIFVLIYFIATIIGFITLLPAGIISFDVVMVVLLCSIGSNKNLALTSIIIYRLAYTLIPLFIISVVSTIKNWGKINVKYNSLPKIISIKSAFFALRFFVFISGPLLLLLTAFPQIFFKIREIYFLSSATMLHFSKGLVVIVGFLLLVMANLLKHKSKGIYRLTIFFLLIGSLLTIAKSFNYIATGYLILIALFLIVSKNEFYRKSFIVSTEDLISTTLMLTGFWILYLILGYINVPIKHIEMHNKLAIALHTYQNLVSIGTIGFVLSLLYLYSIYLLGKHLNKMTHTYIEDCASDITEFLKKHNGTSLTHLIYLKDKYVFFSTDKKGMIQYTIISNKLIVLGNPLGDRENLSNLISEFYDFADSYDYVPVFFEISSSMLDLLHDYGYEFMKLGEAAIVNLNEFTIQGQKMQKVRTCVNKINKANYTFEIATDITDNLISELKIISDEWLNGKKEMGFSMGFFDPEYIKRSPIGIVKDENQQIKAFVTIMPTYGENKMFCSDLMRYSRDTPRGLMDYMFVNLLLWGKENGYNYFNFGVSPLSNVGFSKYSFLSERLASQIYYNGSAFYSFEGLKKFKGKYAHNWEPKMLAYRNRFSLPITMLQTNLVVSKPEQKTRK